MYEPNFFLIFGYGVPKDIFKDENYNFYLKTVFNRIYDRVTEGKIKKPVILCGGGKTDCYKPSKHVQAVRQWWEGKLKEIEK
ncbi:MAG: hypothetical protein AAB444_01065 [Patescibacteria group bacterium]